MKTRLATITVLGFAIGPLLAGPETIIYQRAKELNNQNNVRQGVATPAQPAQPAKPATATPVAQVPGLTRLHSDLAAIKLNVPATPTQNQFIMQDLMALPTGAAKPNPASATKLANDLSAALGVKTLPANDRTRLIQNINAMLNPAGLPATQRQAIVDDIQAIFQANGVPRNNAVNIANQVKALSAEVQKGGTK